MPNVEDVTAQFLGSDVVWVCGGSVAALLALWRLHEVDVALAAAWQSGVVLTGVSAGSICWHVGERPILMGPRYGPVTDGLGLVPYSNGVHYDSEADEGHYSSAGHGEDHPPGYATMTAWVCLSRDIRLRELLRRLEVVERISSTAAWMGVVNDAPLAVVRAIVIRKSKSGCIVGGIELWPCYRATLRRLRHIRAA